MIEKEPGICFFCGEDRRIAIVDIPTPGKEGAYPVSYTICGECMNKPLREILQDVIKHGHHAPETADSTGGA